MAEIGIDLTATGATPKRLTDAAVEASDVVITMGAATNARSTRASDTRLDLDDPAGQGLEAAVRPIRDEIDRRVRELITELLPNQPAGAVAASTGLVGRSDGDGSGGTRP
jgi:arsenate reductase